MTYTERLAPARIRRHDAGNDVAMDPTDRHAVVCESARGRGGLHRLQPPGRTLFAEARRKRSRSASGDQVLQSFVADGAWPAPSIRIPLSTAVLGTADSVEMQISVDRTLLPATLPAGGRDNRDFGIQVYHAFVVTR